MAGGYWHITDRILKKGNTGYDFIGNTPFVSVNTDTNEFDFNVKAILLDIKETLISLDGNYNNHIITPVYLECQGYSSDDGGFVYVGKTSSSFGTPVDLTAYLYIGPLTDPSRIPIKAIEFVGVTSGNE